MEYTKIERDLVGNTHYILSIYHEHQLNVEFQVFPPT